MKKKLIALLVVSLIVLSFAVACQAQTYPVAGGQLAEPAPTASQQSQARADSYEITTYAEDATLLRIFDKEACVLVYDGYQSIAAIPVSDNSPLFLDCY